MTQHFVRPCGFAGGGGIRYMPALHFGVQLEVRYVLAPATIDNEFDETHSLGGVVITSGLRLRTIGQRLSRIRDAVAALSGADDGGAP